MAIFTRRQFRAWLDGASGFWQDIRFISGSDAASSETGTLACRWDQIYSICSYPKQLPGTADYHDQDVARTIPGECVGADEMVTAVPTHPLPRLSRFEGRRNTMLSIRRSPPCRLAHYVLVPRVPRFEGRQNTMLPIRTHAHIIPARRRGRIFQEHE